MKRNNWSVQEQDVVIAVYLDMLRMQSRGESFNKAAIARATLPLLNNRSKGSYEAKLMNISAVMASLGQQTVKGYVPLGHAQKSLADAVLLAVLAMPENFQKAA